MRAGRQRRGFTLIELMVAIGILLVLGVMVIGFLRGALTMSRTGTSRGKAYETAQTVLRQLQDDLEQVCGEPANPGGSTGDLAFTVTTDPWGRQMLMFTRAWGEEQGSHAGHDAGRAAPGQGYGADFDGRNVYDRMKPSRGNLEVVWMMEPVGTSLRLYRAERSPPGTGGLINSLGPWLRDYTLSPTPAVPDDIVPAAWLDENNLGGRPIWSSFELVADNVVALSLECWDDWQERTVTWFAGPGGPVSEWFMQPRLAAGQYALPRAVRITLIVAPDAPIGADTTLAGNISRTDAALAVEDAANFPDLASPLAYLRVDGELIAYASRSGETFGSLARGALGTRPADHKDGTRVVSGAGFQRVFQFPVAR